MPDMKQKVVKTDAEWRALLTPAQYAVLRRQGTERPYSSPLDKEHRAGTFACAGCQLALFSSETKFDSHTGWPSFTVPIEPGNVVKRRDFSMLIPRTEVRSAHGDSHLGHVFPDGPAEAGGLRYCINSAALRFIHLDDLEREGYGAYRKLFDPARNTGSAS